MSDTAAAQLPLEGQAFPEPNLSAPQLTLRAVLTGMLLGALLAPCNIYSGLKIGWSFNMSISAALVSYAFWQGLGRFAAWPPWGLLENNINQTAASAAASIAGAGLVAPIPALTLLTGQKLAWPALAGWTFTVSVLGVVVAVSLRRQMLLRDRLVFPQGVATAATIREIYARGREAMARVRVLIAGGLVAAALKLVDSYVLVLPKLAFGAVGMRAWGALRASGAERITLANLGFVLDSSLLMVAFGAIIGVRSGLSLLLGALVAWGVLAPWVLAQGWAQAGAPDAYWYGALLEWLLWPGVAMMVTASLTSFAFSWRSIVAAIASLAAGRRSRQGVDRGGVPARWLVVGLIASFVLAVGAQVHLFDIGLPLASAAVLLTFALAVVAGRVAGETGITPIGAMGKVTQLTFGVAAPGQAATNLMAANVTGGAASQCADMLHDLKTGLLVGASPRHQAVAQLFGVLAGAMAGSAAYLLLVPDPQTMLLSPEWPAPAVATWKAVAEVFVRGIETMPPGSVGAMLTGGLVGVALAAAERVLPARFARWLPSPASVGLAFVLPAWNAISMCVGGVLALLLGRYAKRWRDRFLIVLAGGIVAGESLAGVAASIHGVLAGP